MRRVAATAVALLLVAGACGHGGKVGTKSVPTSVGGDATSSSTAPADTSTTAGSAAPGDGTTIRPATTSRPGTTSAAAPVGVKLTRVASVNGAVALAQAPNDDALYVALQSGQVDALRGGQVGTVLDVSTSITSGGERGLLGLAFAPNRPAMDIYYTDSSGNIAVDEYGFAGGRTTGGPRRVLSVGHPQFANHNGGNLAYGPDGRLYAGTGDGGSAGDPSNHAQNPASQLGKILRVDAATNGASAEVWMYGLRNPWRWSFDKATGDMWIGDVGQNEWEELDFAAAGTHGQNFGWNLREGKHQYNGPPPPGNVDPVYDYHHDNGVCAVTGGYVYRGTRLTGWSGRYLFADYCVGKVMALTRDGGNVSVRDTGLATTELSSFGQDRSGELYVLSQDTGIYRMDPR